MKKLTQGQNDRHREWPLEKIFPDSLQNHFTSLVVDQLVKVFQLIKCIIFLV